MGPTQSASHGRSHGSQSLSPLRLTVAFDEHPSDRLRHLGRVSYDHLMHRRKNQSLPGTPLIDNGQTLATASSSNSVTSIRSAEKGFEHAFLILSIVLHLVKTIQRLPRNTMSHDKPCPQGCQIAYVDWDGGTDDFYRRALSQKASMAARMKDGKEHTFHWRFSSTCPEGDIELYDNCYICDNDEWPELEIRKFNIDGLAKLFSRESLPDWFWPCMKFHMGEEYSPAYERILKFKHRHTNNPEQVR